MSARLPPFTAARGVMVFLGHVMRSVPADNSLRQALIVGNIVFTAVHVLTLVNGESAASGMNSNYRAFNA